MSVAFSRPRGRIVRGLVCGLLLLAPVACRSGRPAAESPEKKIRLPLERLDADGLVGPPGALREMRYEFCIPDRRECRAEVYRLDPSIEFMPGSRGRAGCGAGELLCVGSTHQPEFRGVLTRLSELAYVHRIVEWTGE